MAPATENSIPMLTTESTSINNNSNYKLVSFAVDLTGKKLIDEICHISAYQEDGASFDQWIMTYRDISRSSIRTHGIRIFTMLGKYRVLKDTSTMKSIHTKSEYSALNDFIEWLGQQKGEKEGVILAYHDHGPDKVTPFLMEALDRYNLVDEFFKHVKGFTNLFAIAAARPDVVKGRSLALRSLARRLLGDEKGEESLEQSKEAETSDQEQTTKNTEEKPEEKKEQVPEEETGKESNDEPKERPRERPRRGKRMSRDKSLGQLRDKERDKIIAMQGATFRALTTFKLLHKFSLNAEAPNLFEEELVKNLSSQGDEIKTLEKQRELANKVRSLRPIFVGRIRMSPKDRSRAVLLRRYLIEAELDYVTLKEAYELGSTDAILKILENTSATKRKQHQDELLELIVKHFGGDPKKDVNANNVKPDVNGGGDHPDNGSTTESDSEEFAEAEGDNN